MRLLFCEACRDVQRVLLNGTLRSCSCGQSTARRAGDGKISVAGIHAVVLGFTEGQLLRAVEHAPDDGNGHRFYAFVMPKLSSTVVRENQPDVVS